MNSLLHRWKTKFTEWDEIFREKVLRERIMLCGMAVALVFFLIDTTINQPVNRERDRIDLGMTRGLEEVERLQQEETMLSNIELTEAERRVIDELKHLNQQLREIETQMGAKIADLIPPREIVSVLEELLAEDQSLKLISLRSRPPARIGSDQDLNGADPKLGLYRHGLRIEIEGGFHATLNYLKRLENSEWNLLWDRFEFRVDQYPKATITIDLHTLSDREEWIGV